MTLADANIRPLGLPPGLPNEVWILIFFHYLLGFCGTEVETSFTTVWGRPHWARLRVPSLSHRDLGEHIGHLQLVCSKWQSIVVGAPRLWTLGRITLSSSALDQIIISRSGAAPLGLFVDQHSLQNRAEAYEQHGGVIPSLTDLLSRITDGLAPRLSVFSYAGGARTMGHIISALLPDMPQLETLHLNCSPCNDEDEDNGLTSCNIPHLPPDHVTWTKLQSLSLQGFTIGDFSPNQIGGLVDLSIDVSVGMDDGNRGIMPQTLLKMLRSCPLLETLQLRGNLHNFPETIPADMDSTPIRLSHLKQLDLLDPGSRSVTLLQRIITPPEAKVSIIRCTEHAVDDDPPQPGGIGHPIAPILSVDVHLTSYLRELDIRGDVVIKGWNTCLPPESQPPRPNPSQTYNPFAFADESDEVEPNLFVNLIDYRGVEVIFNAVIDMLVYSNLGRNIEVMTLVYPYNPRNVISSGEWADIFRGMPSLRTLKMSIHAWAPVLEGLAGANPNTTEGENITLLTRSTRSQLEIKTGLDELRDCIVIEAAESKRRSVTTTTLLPCPNLATLSLAFECNTPERPLNTTHDQKRLDFIPHIPNLDKRQILTCLQRRRNARLPGSVPTALSKLELHFDYSHQVMEEYKAFLEPRLTGLAEHVHFESTDIAGTEILYSYEPQGIAFKKD